MSGVNDQDNNRGSQEPNPQNADDIYLRMDGTNVQCLLCTHIVLICNGMKNLSTHCSRVHGVNVLENVLSKYVDDERKPIQCLLCLRKYGQNHNFVRHIKDDHTLPLEIKGIRVLKCKFCGNAEYRIHEMMAHLGIHVANNQMATW